MRFETAALAVVTLALLAALGGFWWSIRSGGRLERELGAESARADLAEEELAVLRATAPDAVDRHFEQTPAADDDGTVAHGTFDFDPSAFTWGADR